MCLPGCASKLRRAEQPSAQPLKVACDMLNQAFEANSGLNHRLLMFSMLFVSITKSGESAGCKASKTTTTTA